MARILLIDDDANRPDIVVTDTIMPNQEGIETVIKQTRTAPEVAIIAMSGGGRTGNCDFLAMAEKLGTAKMMPKPFRPRELVESVQSLLPRAA